MDCYFDEDCVLHVVPRDSFQAMAMRYYSEEFQRHGPRMLELHTEVPGDPRPHSRKPAVAEDD